MSRSRRTGRRGSRGASSCGRRRAPPEGAHEVGLRGAADARDVRAGVDGELHGIRADPTGGSDDEHPVAAGDVGRAQRLQGGDRRHRHRGGLHRDGRRTPGQPGHRHDGQLGERPAGRAVHGIPDRVAGHALADALDLPAARRGRGCGRAVRRPRASRAASGRPVIRCQCPGRLRPPRRDEDLAGAGHGVGHVLEPKHVGRAVAVLHDGLHGVSLSWKSSGRTPQYPYGVRCGKPPPSTPRGVRMPSARPR